MNYVLKFKDPLNEWNVILIYMLWTFYNPKNCNYLKSSFNYLNFIV